MAKKKGGISNAIVWVILVLLIIGLAGFGATSFGGNVRSIGSVGDTEIPVTRYAQALRRELRGLEAQTGQRITMAQARQFGLDQAVLRQVVALTALEDEAAALGLSVGDEAVREEVVTIPAFQGLDGQFDMEAYEYAIRNSGQTVPEFEESIRRETARTLLQAAIGAGAAVPESYVDTLFTFARETRDITAFVLSEDNLAERPDEPDDATLKAFYDDNPALFTQPERRRITYAWVRPEMLTDSIVADEEALRRLYDARAAEYVRPERRLVERLVFADETAAQAAADAIEAGTTEFDTLVEDRGLTLEDVDIGEVTQDDLASAADAVFALSEPGIAGPAPSPLGPALYRVNAILSAQETSFDEARADLQAEYALDAARRAIEDEVEPVEDLLAGGATLEEVADETMLERGEILWSPGVAGVENQDIDAYPAFRTAAAEAEEGDFPELEILPDGGLFALRLDEVIPPSVQPYDEVEIAVIEAWEQAEIRDRLTAQAEDLAAALTEDAAVDTMGAEERTETGLLRDAFLEGLPNETVTAAFEMTEGDTRVIGTETGALVLRLDAVTPPSSDDEDAATIETALTERTAQSYAQDMVDAFTAAIEADRGVELDQAAVTAVQSQFP